MMARLPRCTGFGPKAGVLQQFLVIAGITISISMATLAYAVSQRFQSSVIQTAAAEGALLIDAFIGPSIQDLATSSTLSPERSERLNRLLSTRLRERVKVIKIWLRDGTLVYASNQQVTGQKFPSSQIDDAFIGKVSGFFDDLDSPEDEAERKLQLPLIEIYAPFFRTGTDEIIAVGQVFNDGTRLASELKSIRLASAGIVSAISAPMMLLLFLLVRRASSEVTSHRASLQSKISEAEAMAMQNDQLRQEADKARMDALHSNECLLGQIGQDLHDGPIQLVSVLALKLTELTDSNSMLNAAETSHSAANVHNLTADILTELRDLSTGLVLPELEGLTAAEVLTCAVREHENVTGTKVDCEIDDLPATTSHPFKVCLYRVVQEGLNNALAHAGGQGQRVRAWLDENLVIITVSDSGKGMPDNGLSVSPSNPRTGLGLVGLRRRVEAFNGRFEVSSQAGNGTVVRATLPLPNVSS